jgi:MoxR-like ATPase
MADPSHPDFGFELLDPADRRPQRGLALARRSLPPWLGDHKQAAQRYRPDTGLVDAVNVALAAGAPLLLTGEPGTGKTQLASYLAWYFDIPFLPLHVRSDTSAEHLLYSFDAVAYLHAASDPRRTGEKIGRAEFVQPGPLWRAYEEEGPAVVLIDEIDKASRDFPNDLLHVLDQHEFHVRETDVWVRRGERPPPVLVITSNSERRLPEPFLRRCVFHHIQFTEELVRTAVASHGDDFPKLDERQRESAIQRFLDLRGREIRKPPATAELLVWLTVLSARGGVDADFLASCKLTDLPALATLVKDRDDLALLG